MSGALQGLLALLTAFLKLVPLMAAWLAGRRQMQSQAQTQALANARRAHEIDEDVAGLDSAALRDQLRRPGG